MKTPAQRVDILMSDLPDQSSNHAVSKNEDLALAIRYTLEKVKAGSLPMGFKKFYEQHLKDEFDGPSYHAVYSYCREVLRVDTRTAEAL